MDRILSRLAVSLASLARLSRLSLGLMLALALGSTAHAEAAKRKVIIDDDGFALTQMMLLRAPDVEVLGLTTVSGDLWANRVTVEALRGLELMGRTDVPVVPGATYPLLNSEALTDRWEAIYGKLTWRGAWMHKWVEPTVQATPVYHGPNDPVDLPWGNPHLKPADDIAASFLIRMVHKYPGQITIIACGPMTNIALAQRLDPQFASLAKELVYMGGSLNPRQTLGNEVAAQFAREFANSPRREFNFRFDPEAASIVSRSPWKKIVAVPVDPSTDTQLTPTLLARLSSVAGAGERTLIGKMAPGFPLWDEIAAAVWLAPRLVTASEPLYIDVDTQFDATYGDTLSWRSGYQPGLGEAQADVVRSIDAARIDDLIVQLLTDKAQAPNRRAQLP